MKFNIKTDSRKVKPGDTFVALQGIQSDGHDYIEKAIENGATTIVATHGEYSVKTILVEDTRKYLMDYLKEHYGKYLEEMTLIAFTGTNGKSTSVHLIYEALNLLGKDCASIGTIGYFLKEGKVCYLPNTSPDLCDLYELIMDAYNHGYRYVALEASSQGLGYGRLDGILFDYAIFSNLTRDHLDYHKTFENYALAKQKLFKQLKKNGVAIVNGDDAYKDYFLLEENKNITFGFHNNDYQITSFHMDENGSDFKVEIKEKEYPFHTSLVGEYNVMNLIPIIIILLDLGFDIVTIAKTVSRLHAPEGRIEKIPFKTNAIYIDYAHTPDGVEKVVSTIKAITKGNVYTVFCCRGNRDVGRRKGMMEAACKNSTLAIITNDHVFNEDPEHVIQDMLEGNTYQNYEIIRDRKKAIYRGIDLLKEKDALLLLGHGHEEVLINANHEKIPFIEREIVEDYIQKKTC